jgi:tRNA(Ile)-lysidine synthase
MNKSKSRGILNEFKKQLSSAFQNAENKHFIIGVSGGSDSMVLLYLFKKAGISATVVHCNYQLRGESSDKDQELVEQISGFWGFDCISLRFDQPASTGINFQNWAREKRYLAFRDLKKEEHADAIAIAHHLDDQLETIFQKILRGTGMESWRGMDCWDGELFRPLLNLSKDDLLDYASEKNIPYRLDATNEESTYARNFLRNSWFPLMNDLFPGWKKNVLKIPDWADKFELIAGALLDLCEPVPGKIEREFFLNLPDEIQPVLVYKLIKKLNPGVYLTEGALDNISKLKDLQTGKSLQLTSDSYIFRERNHFLYQKNEEVPKESDSKIKIDTGDVKNREYNFDGHKARLDTWDRNIDRSILQMDEDSLKWPLTIRKWETGDSIEPLGLNGKHQKVSDLLTNKKIKSSEKQDAKIIETFDNRISAVIFPHLVNGEIGTIAEWAKCSDVTTEVLTIEKN